MRKIFFVSLVLFLASCSTIKNNPILPLSICQMRSWWQEFKDPLMDELAIDLLNQNLDIRLASARIEEARAIRYATVANFYPTFTGTSNIITIKDPLDYGISSEFYLLKEVLNTDWQFDIFGKNKALYNANQARQKAAYFTREDVAITALSDLFIAIIQLRAAVKTLHSAQNLLVANQTIADLYQARADAGLIDYTFTERAKAEAEQIKTQIPLAEASIKAAQYQIERLMGYEPEKLRAYINYESKDFIIPGPQKILATNIGVIRNRPDVRVAREQMIAANYDFKNAELQLWPQISFDGLLGAWSGSAFLATTIIGPIMNPIWTLAANATSPLLNFNLFYSLVEVNRAREKQAILKYENIVLTALQQVYTARQNYFKFSEAMNDQAKSLEYRRTTIKLIEARFKGGLIDSTDLNTAFAELSQAELDFINKQANAAIAYINLQKATGN